MPDRTLAGSLFAGLTPEQTRTIAGCARPERFEKGAKLFRAGDDAASFFLLLTGRVALTLHDAGRAELTVETIEPGQVVGWSWLFEPHRWHFDGHAVEAVDALAFDAARVRAACDADHELGYELMRRFGAVIVDRLQHTRLRLLDVYGSHPRD